MFTKLWFRRTIERSVFTFMQVVVTLSGGDSVVDKLDLDWLSIVKLAAIGAALSVATSVIKSGVGDPENPGLE